MSITSALVAGRRAAESRMTSSCTIKRESGATAQDEATGAVVPVWTDEYTDEPFRLGGADRGASGSRVLDTPAGEVALATRVASFRHDLVLRDGDLIDVTAGERAGLVLRVVEATGQDQATALRVLVVEDRRPEEWGA